MTEIPSAPVDDVDTSRANPARVYNYWLGGKDNYEADRALGDAMIAQIPSLQTMARANRRFLFRAVRHLVAEFGITQLLDIGSGLPTACNVHEIAQDTDPAARVVYVDQDLTVAAHSRALLTSTAAGRVEFIIADARHPTGILNDPAFAATLDLGKPVGLMLVSVLMYFPDDVAHDIVATLLDALPAGSFLTVSHPTADFDPAAAENAVAAARAAGLTYLPRTREQVAAFFTGLDLVAPGVVPMLAWPDHTLAPAAVLRTVYYWVGMARKP